MRLHNAGPLQMNLFDSHITLARRLGRRFYLRYSWPLLSKTRSNSL